MLRDFPCGPVAKISPSKAGSVGWISGQGTKSPHASGPKKTQTASNRSNAVTNVIKTLKFNKDFKNSPHQKKTKNKKQNRYSEAGRNPPPPLKWFCKFESHDPTAEAEVCPRRTWSYPGPSGPSRNQCRLFCHLLLLSALKQNEGLISFTDQHMRYASDMSACQAHKHNKARRQQWKKSPAPFTDYRPQHPSA